MTIEIDNVLSGVIILLIIVVVWKWHKGSGSCGKSSITLSCGCQYGKCRCRYMSRISVRNQRCRGGGECVCGSLSGKCKCGPKCKCQKKAVKKYMRESMTQGCDMPCRDKQLGTAGYEPVDDTTDGNYSGDTVQKMSLEPQVIQSQQNYIDGLGFAGLPTGSSQETVLEELGRDGMSANFVGLTARKFCKARQLAAPSIDARQVPSETIKEWCSVDMDELV